MMGLKILNTETKKLEEFNPIEEGKVRFYHCGPTVYWTQHIGNMRSMVMADLVNRSLGYLGYKVALARNYTDVGHLVSDGDDGEDKMEKGAKREGLTPQEIAQKYIDIFEKHTNELNVIEPIYKPKATQYVNKMIDMVKVLLEKGYAYTTPKAIYFDISKADDYTRLSGQRLELNKEGAGFGDVSDSAKKNSADFAVWFFRTGPHKNAIQWWESPFHSDEIKNGAGFPGWHIECSAMAIDLLGSTLDIHMGGIEHIPVHHTNEIAQSEAYTDSRFVNYWIHNEHLNVDGGKMSKSSGTSYSLEDIKDKGFSPLDLRYFFLQAHYRSKQNFTWESLQASATARQRLIKQLVDMEISVGNVDKKYKEVFVENLSNDFNIPGALSVVWELFKDYEVSSADKLATILDFDKVLGLDLKNEISIYDNQSKDIEISSDLQSLLDERAEARNLKNWKRSDEIRDVIQKEYGYKVLDEAGGQRLE